MRRFEELVAEGDELAENEHYDAALATYTDAVAVAQENNQFYDHDVIDVSFKATGCVRHIISGEAAIEFYQRIAGATEDRTTMARAYYEIGIIHLDHKSWLDSLIHFDLAQEHLGLGHLNYEPIRKSKVEQLDNPFK